MHLKEEVYKIYSRLLQDKILQQQNVLRELSASAANETKSTAGDKHETALAMLQIEQENKRKQLGELLQQRKILQRLDPLKSAATVVNGSLVKTNKGYFYMSVALGKTMLADKIVYALSPTAPLGQKLMGCGPGATIEMNGTIYEILSVA